MEQKQEPDQKIPGPPTHRLAPAHDSKVTCYSRLRARAHTHTYADTLSNTCTHVHVHACLDTGTHKERHTQRHLDPCTNI